MYILYFVYSFISWLTLFISHFLAIMNNATINITCTGFVWTHASISLGYIARSGIAGSGDTSVFNVLRKCQAIFQRPCTLLQPHQQLRVAVSPHPCLYVSVFLIIIILVGVQWYLIMVLLCITPMANVVEHVLNPVVIGLLYTFFEELSIQVLCLFKNKLDYFSFYWEL